MKFTIYVGGTFDLFHYGHVRLFSNIKNVFKHCNLVVAVNSDRFCQEYKRSPIIKDKERLEVVKACKNVDNAIIIPTWASQENFITKVNPDYIILGSDWKNKNYFKQLNVTQEFLDEIDCNILFMPYTESISTTEIIKRIETQNGKNDS